MGTFEDIASAKSRRRNTPRTTTWAVTRKVLITPLTDSLIMRNIKGVKGLKGVKGVKET